jgi:hypothetical protein
VDGRVAGTWQTKRDRQGMTLAAAPFEPLAPPVRRALAAETEALGRFLGVGVSLAE